MFRIISAEIKKIVSKPGIYILSVLLALILVLGALIYKPTVKESTYFELKGDTFIEKYTEFSAGENENAGKKAESKTKLNNSIQSINDYFVIYNSETLTKKEHIDVLLKKIEELFGEYQDCSSDASNEDDIISIRSQLVTSYEELNNSIETAIINSKNNSYSILTTKENYENYTFIYEQVLNWAKVNAKKEDITNHIIEFENKYAEKFNESLNSFIYPTLSKDFVKTYTSTENGTKFSTLKERLNKIEVQIEEHKKLSNDPAYNTKNADKMDELANLYVDTVNTYTELIKYELITNAYSNISTSESLKMLYLSDYSNYNSKSLLERYNYLFEHNKVERDYGKPLTIGITSNEEINAYDYSYFVLKVFSFVIIVYAIMSCCHSIAGEIKEGSMRYLAIRPVSRTTMFFGKWLSIILMSLILMLFSTIISLLVGGAVYGFNSNTILTIFNGSIAFTIHPIGMIGIYLLSMLCELIIYSLIAMLLSVLFKSDLISMTILLVVYLLNTILPMFVQGSNTWLAYYPFSHISVYSLFGSSVYADSNNLFNLIFGAKVYAGTHIALTSSIIVLLSVIISAIAIKVFKNKEL